MKKTLPRRHCRGTLPSPLWPSQSWDPRKTGQILLRQVTTRLVSQVWAIGASLAQFPLPVFTHLVEDLLGTGPGLPVVPAGEGRLGQVGQHLQVVRAHLVG